MVTCRAIVLVACLWGIPTLGQVTQQAARVYDGVGLSPRLGAKVPLDVAFTLSDGTDILLKDLFGNGRPVVLTFVYHTCPMLCSALLDGLTRALMEVPWDPGKAYDLVTVSFSPEDPPERAAEQRSRYLRQLDRTDASWHFLTGEASSIRALTEAAGFQFKWMEDQNEYAHPAAVIFMSPDGTITRYLADVAPSSRDVRAAIVEASDGKVGSLLDRAFLFCFQFDPAANSYVLAATRAMQVGGGLTVLALLASLSLLWVRDFRRRTIA